MEVDSIKLKASRLRGPSKICATCYTVVSYVIQWGDSVEASQRVIATEMTRHAPLCGLTPMACHPAGYCSSSCVWGNSAMSERPNSARNRGVV